MMTVIREAVANDVPRLVEMGRRHIEGSRYGRFIDCDSEAMAATARMLIDSPDGLVLVAERDGEVVGMIGTIATLHPYSGRPVMAELFWWVEPDRRGCGARLLRMAEDWARRHGVGHSVMVSPSPEVSAFYRRVGYELLEEQFIKAL